MNIYYLGPNGSFSEIAVRKSFPHDGTFIALSSFNEIADAVCNDYNSVGALVIENSISSSVHQNIDILFQNEDLYITGETFMKIQMELIGLPGSTIDTITDVYSYPQALSQCTEFTKKHQVTVHKTKSTSEAANHIVTTQDSTKAAIGSALLAEINELQIIEHDIANETHNISRWIFISGKKTENIAANKVTYIFKVKHEPGSLVAVLNKIAEHNGNLSKIESRPLPGTNWEYGFWVDVEIPNGSKEKFDKLMKEATFECRIVGGYTKGSLLI